MAKSLNGRSNHVSRKFLVKCFVAAVTILFLLLHITYFSSLLEIKSFRSSEASGASKERIKLLTRLSSLQAAVSEKAFKLKALRDSKDSPSEKDESDPILPSVVTDIPNLSRHVDLHRILTLSDELHQTTDISEMMSWYGESDGGGSCKEDFGNALINKWRNQKKSYCRESDSQSLQDSERSSIDCFLISQTRHHGDGDNLCLMKNVAVNIGLFGDDSITRPVVQKYVETRHNVQPYIKFPKGFVKSSCIPDEELWQSKFMPGWNEDWTVNALEIVSAVHTEINGSTTKRMLDHKEVICDEWVDHPVLVVQRDTFANFFHDSEDFFNAFIAMAVLKWKKSSTQIYLTDLYPKGPFWNIWSEVFSPKGSDLAGLRTADSWDLRNTFGQKISKHNDKKEYHVCYKQLAVGIYGPAAPVTVASWDTPCKRTALVRAYSDHVIRGLEMQGSTHYASAEPSRTIVITYMARRPSSEWPEKKYCSDTESFFLCELWKSFGARSLGRMVSNEVEVMAALKALEKRTYRNGALVEFRDVDYNILTFEEQIMADLGTDIMIGPHGAGLMHNIFMRDRATLIELFIDGSDQNRHFHNLAHWYGRTYVGVSINNPIDVGQMVQTVVAEVEKIKLDKF